jgi:predicted nucleic acid-binding protein
MAAPRLILDSGALSALAVAEPRTIAWAYLATQRQMLYGIPAPVLAETLTGRPSDAAIHRVIPAQDIILDTTAAIARIAGVLRYKANRPDLTIDALVVATATQYRKSIILTSDPDNLTLLASHCPEAGLTIRGVNVPTVHRGRRCT